MAGNEAMQVLAILRWAEANGIAVTVTQAEALLADLGGTRAPWVRWSDEDAAEVTKRYNAGESVTQIAKATGITRTRVNGFVTRLPKPEGRPDGRRRRPS